MSAKPGSKHRTREQVLRDRADIARWYCQGEPQWKIGERLGFTQAQISLDLKAIRAEWIKASVLDFDDLRSRELAKIDQREIVYWEAWQRSMEPRQTTSTKKASGEQGERNEAAIKKEMRDGNPEFLKGVERCSEQRCKILGLYAPTQVNLSGMSNEELIEHARIAFCTEFGSVDIEQGIIQAGAFEEAKEIPPNPAEPCFDAD